MEMDMFSIFPPPPSFPFPLPTVSFNGASNCLKMSVSRIRWDINSSNRCIIWWRSPFPANPPFLQILFTTWSHYPCRIRIEFSDLVSCFEMIRIDFLVEDSWFVIQMTKLTLEFCPTMPDGCNDSNERLWKEPEVSNSLRKYPKQDFVWWNIFNGRLYDRTHVTWKKDGFELSRKTNSSKTKKNKKKNAKLKYLFFFLFRIILALMTRNFLRQSWQFILWSLYTQNLMTWSLKFSHFCISRAGVRVRSAFCVVSGIKKKNTERKNWRFLILYAIASYRVGKVFDIFYVLWQATN